MSGIVTYVIKSPILLHEKNNVLDIFDRPSRNAGGKNKKYDNARREHLDGRGSTQLPPLDIQLLSDWTDRGESVDSLYLDQ